MTAPSGVAIRSVGRLDFPLRPVEPFLFLARHDDASACGASLGLLRLVAVLEPRRERQRHQDRLDPAPATTHSAPPPDHPPCSNTQLAAPTELSMRPITTTPRAAISATPTAGPSITAEAACLASPSIPTAASRPSPLSLAELSTTMIPSGTADASAERQRQATRVQMCSG